MSSLLDTEVYGLLPPNLQTEKTKALSIAIAAEFRPLVEYISKTVIYSDILDLDENVCDLLALIFDISIYKQSWDIDTKRNMIRTALMAVKGTKAAVQEIISTIYSGAVVKEWFEYGGDPYYFKVDVDISKTGVSAGTYDEIAKNVGYCKNVRSELESIHYALAGTGSVYLGVTGRVGNTLRVQPRQEG